MASKILTQYKQRLSGLELEPSMGGCFELTINGELAYSKLASGEFPDEQAMVDLVGQKLG